MPFGRLFKGRVEMALFFPIERLLVWLPKESPQALSLEMFKMLLVSMWLPNCESACGADERIVLTISR